MVEFFQKLKIINQYIIRFYFGYRIISIWLVLLHFQLDDHGESHFTLINRSLQPF